GGTAVVRRGRSSAGRNPGLQIADDGDAEAEVAVRDVMRASGPVVDFERRGTQATAEEHYAVAAPRAFRHCSQIHRPVIQSPVTTESPHISVHVEQSPGVGPLQPDRVRAKVRVAAVPGVVAQFRRAIAEVILGRAPRPSGPLPLNARRQAVLTLLLIA